MVCQAIKPLLDMVPPDIFSDDPEELIALASARLALQEDGQAGPAQRRPAADRQRRRLPRRLLRVRPAQGLPRFVEHHRDEGRPALAGLGARAALPLDRRARRRVRCVGLPQEGQRRVHPGAGTGRRVVRGRDPPRVAGRLGHHQGRPGDRAWRSPTGPSTTPTPSSAHSTRGGPSSSSSTRASCPTTSSRTSSASASRARSPRSTSRWMGCRRPPRRSTAASSGASPTSAPRWTTSSGRSMTPNTAGTASTLYRLAIQSTIDADMAPPGKHVLSCFIQYTPYKLRESDWDSEKENLGDTVQRTLERFFPGFGDLVLQREVRTPLDIERTVGLSEGTSSPASSSRRRCSSSGRRRAGRSIGRRSTATTSAAPGRIPAAA